MGVDVKSIAGIGLKLTDEMLEKIRNSKDIPIELWEYDPAWELNEELGFNVEIAGSSCTGDIYYYLFLEGEILQDFRDNIVDVISKLKECDIHVDDNDFKLIRDIFWY
jgi:hypothetical protein